MTKHRIKVTVTFTEVLTTPNLAHRGERWLKLFADAGVTVTASSFTAGSCIIEGQAPAAVDEAWVSALIANEKQYPSTAGTDYSIAVAYPLTVDIAWEEASETPDLVAREAAWKAALTAEGIHWTSLSCKPVVLGEAEAADMGGIVFTALSETAKDATAINTLGDTIEGAATDATDATVEDHNCVSETDPCNP